MTNRLDDRGFPVIRLEISGMKHTIMHAFSEYMTNLDSDIQAAVEAYCGDENIKRVISQAVSTEIDAAIKEVVHNYYRYGDGKELIKSAVARKLSEDGEL